MSETKNYESVLSGIKEKLDENKMSALVGAGFSKNFNSNIFPSWWQLLRDMVNETRGKSIEEQFKLLSKGKDKLRFQDYLNKTIDQHIDEIGPLQAVSDFIKKKGYREAADYRIEEATPVVEFDQHKRYITYREKGSTIKREILPEEMRIHEKFVALPWNNIYTTNYDNLLESSIDHSIKDQFDKKVEELHNRLDAIEIEIIGKSDRVVQLEMQIPEETTQMNIGDFGQTNSVSDGLDKKIDLENLKRELNNVTLQLSFLKSTRDNLASDIRKFERLQHDFSSLVRHSSELAFKKNGNIIKIHGSVRTAEERDYGFDGDIRKHYVISQEDFDTYPVKHEAFTQLMRISLLQESFCIIGFSGIDSNFLAWIDWVRDVIERKRNKPGNKDKLYLIDVDKNPSYADRELFFINHGITVIPLWDSECINFLQKQTGRKINCQNMETRDIIELFVDFLSLDSPPNRFRVAYYLTKQQDYKDILSRLPSFYNKESSDKKNLEVIKQVDQILALKKYNRIPNLKWDMIYQQYHYIRRAGYFLDTLNKNNIKNYLKILLCLIDDQNIPVSVLFIGIEGTYKKLKQEIKKVGKSFYEDFQILELREAILKSDLVMIEAIIKDLGQSSRQEVRDEVTYQNALRLLYTFDFGNLLDTLASWKPKDHWILKKAGLIGMYDPNQALSLLESYPQEDLMEHLYQLERMAFFSSGIFGSKRAKYSERVKELEDMGLVTSRENINQLNIKLNKEKKTVVPYGYDKFTISESITFGGDSPFLRSLQLFNIMGKTGLPISMPHYRQFEHHEILTPLEALFETYPYPTLAILCQYNEEKITLRLAQDYCYSNKLFHEWESMSGVIQAGILDSMTPVRIKKNLLTFYSEFINVLSPALWEDFFITIWQQEKSEAYLFKESPADKNHFIRNGLRFIAKPSTMLMVINDCLSALDKVALNTQNLIIQFLYELANNKLKDQSWDTANLFAEEELLKPLLERISIEPDLLFIFGNIDYAISESIREQLRSTIKKMDSFVDANEKVWRIFLYYLGKDEQAKAPLKLQIITNEKLWNAGFTGEGISSDSYSYISLYKLRMNSEGQGIEWNKDEAATIFARMVDEIEKIEKYLTRERDTHRYKSILEEMSWFVDFEEIKLRDISTFHSVVKRINDLLSQQKQYKDLIKGLASNEGAQVIWAVNEVSYQLHNNQNFDEHDKSIELIVNKLLLKAPGGLAATFGAFSDWLIAFKHERYFEKYQYLLEKILEIYKDEQPSEFDAPFLEEKLIQVAYILKLWGSSHPLIWEMLKLIKESRFNNTRSKLTYMLVELEL